MPRTESDILAETFARVMEDLLARVFFVDVAQPWRIGIALSGGLDSSVLLHLLTNYVRNAGGSRPIHIHAFHIHHGLSPHADAWRLHCGKAAETLGVAFDASEVEVALDDVRGVEAAARVERYAALARLCRQHQVPLLLMAHHRDDQAETVVLQSLRGAGVAGLAGMATCHPGHPMLGNNLALGRPLLGIGRVQLEAEAVRAGVWYVSDESNSDVRFRRNAVRHDVLPMLEAISPGCTAALARVATHAQTALALLDDLARLDLRTGGVETRPGRRLPLDCLRPLSRERQGNLIRYWLRSQALVLPTTVSLDVLIDQMLGAAGDADPVFDLGTLQCRRYAQCMELVPKIDAAPMPYRFQWRGEDVIDVPQWQGQLRFTPSEQGLPRSLMEHKNLELKTRQGGERMRPHPSRPRKTLKALYQENAIPPWRRACLPLLYAGPALIFAAGLGINHEHTRSDAEESGVFLKWESWTA